MRAWVFAAILMVLGPGAVSAQSGDEAGVRALITRQFADFRSGDVEAAYQKASPMIRQMYQTPEYFGRMVQGGYPMIWAAEDVTFLGLREEDGRLVERVRVRGPDGGLFFFDYEMVMIDGVWRINGVWPVKGDDVSV